MKSSRMGNEIRREDSDWVYVHGAGKSIYDHLALYLLAAKLVDHPTDIK